MKRAVVVFWIGLAALANGAEGKAPLTFGGFLDVYYGFDFNQPVGDRTFTTQASRHNEFAVNLVYVEAKLEKERVRGRLALQAGTSVYANYSGELRYGPAKGPELADLLRHVQEAYGGYRLSDALWLDAGIFLSHIGAESFVSKDNWNYTRSLGADYSPYYQAGVRLSYQPSSPWAASLHLLNGWQNAIETNGDKALGFQLGYTPSDEVSVTYNNFLGKETDLRFFNELVLRFKLSPVLSLIFSSDVGMQKKPAGGSSTWFVETLLAQLQLSETVRLGGRIEYFRDPDQVIVGGTVTPNGFVTWGSSLNVDWQPDKAFLLRNEIRALLSKDAVFAGRSGTKDSSVLFVSSLGLSF